MSFDDVARRMQERDAGIAESQTPIVPPGASPDAVQDFIVDAQRADRKAVAHKDIIFGVILLIVGVVITSVTYSSASQQGGTYVVAYGPIVIGVVKLIRGLSRLGG